MMRAPHPERTTRTLPLLLTVWLTCSPVQAQMRVDRNLSAQSTGVPSLPANAATPSAIPSVPRQPAVDPSSQTGPSGAYASEAMGAAILAKNADYETTFQINQPIPTGSTISKISWRVSLSHKPVGFEAILCWNNQQPCWNMTNDASGSTAAFNGKDATRPFTLHYRVQGGGQLRQPAQGQMNQLIVTYHLPD